MSYTYYNEAVYSFLICHERKMYMTRKLITFLISATVVAVFAVQSIALASPVATFDSTGMSLALSGNIGDKAGISYTVTIAPRSGSEPQFSKTNAPIDICLFETGYGGEISESIRLHPNLEGGEYTAFFACNVDNEDKIFASHFSYINSTEPATAELVKLLNGENSGDKTGAQNASEFYDIISVRTNITKFGIVYDSVYDEQSGTDKIPFISEVVYSMKALQPDSVFTFDTLSDALFEAQAAYDIKFDGLMVADLWSEYLGSQYEKLTELEETEKDKLDELLKNADYKGRSLSDIFTEKFIMSRFICADTRLEIKSLLTQYADVLGIDMSAESDYSQVPDSQLHIIYEGILQEVSGESEIDDIKSYFDKYVEDALYVPPQNNRPSYGGGGGGGGKTSVISGGNLTNPNASTVTPQAPLVPETVPENTAVPVFNDTKGHFAEQSIQLLASKGIISGYPDGSFAPQGKVTRAEFCKIAAVAFGITSDEKAVFDDVSDGVWYEEYVSALAANGIINGYNNQFMPDNPITREDAAVIMQRIFALKNINLTQAEKTFSDSDDISDYARLSVNALATAGIMNGDGMSFYPQNAISRGETAVLVCNSQNFMTGGNEK